MHIDTKDVTVELKNKENSIRLYYESSKTHRYTWVTVRFDSKSHATFSIDEEDSYEG